MISSRVFADVIVVLHAAYVGVVVGGLVLIVIGAARRWRWIGNFWFRMVHLLMIAVVVAEAVGGVTCPLTTWEAQLRVGGGEPREPGTFVGRMVHAVLFYDLPEWVFTLGYCAFGLAVLAMFYWAPPRRPGFLSPGPRHRPAACRSGRKLVE